MGVMACSRNGCSSIMCSQYIPTVGYMCDDCKTEFKKFIELEKHRMLLDFMKSPKMENLDLSFLDD